MVTKQKSTRDAGVPAEIAAAIAQCHAWLNEHARPPRVLDDLPPEQRATIENLRRKDPRILVEMGPADGEDPKSQSTLVRELLRDLLTAKEFEELPERLRTVGANDVSAVLLDDTKTRKALPLLERGLRGVQMLREEAEDRRAAMPRLGLESATNGRTLALVDEVERALQGLIVHARRMMGADPPRTLAEFARFRASWAACLNDAGFSYSQIELLLGHQSPSDEEGQTRLRDAIRKNCARRRRKARTNVDSSETPSAST